MANKKLTVAQRTVPAETMADVADRLPQDGFQLSDDKLNKEYTTTGILFSEFNGNKSFSVMLEDKDGRVITLSAAALKRARVLSKADASGKKAFPKTENIFLASEAEALRNGSVFFHSNGEGMKKDDDFVVPAKIKLHSAILTEVEGKPVIAPYLLKGYRTIVAAYQKRDTFPTFAEFEAELAKTEDRIAGLPAGLTKPEPQDWVKEGEVQNYRHTLVLADVEY